MLSTLVNHNSDLRDLVKKGYALSIDSNYLVVRDIPYLNSNRELCTGAFISKLVFIDQLHVAQEDHQVFFCGAHPHELDGQPIRNLGGGPTSLHLISKDLIVERSFSNKPAKGFANLFEKIESYVTIISGPAINLRGANPLTFRKGEDKVNSVFRFQDSMTSRAEIGDLSSRLENDTVAIIGLGGTGSYVLDFIVKTPVKEIRGFDLDYFHIHNAYRSPGTSTARELGKKKAYVYQKRYEKFRKAIKIKEKYILSDSLADLRGVDFAFVCVDKGSARAEIFDLLIKMHIPFIDVGMGLDRGDAGISGTLRTTYYNKNTASDLLKKRLAPTSDPPEGVYSNNIQISELNALNASLAVIKFKQIRGFYSDDKNYSHVLYGIDGSVILGQQ